MPGVGKLPSISMMMIVVGLIFLTAGTIAKSDIVIPVSNGFVGGIALMRI